MKCPKDKIDLLLQTQENTFGYCCPQCNGVFLKSKGVDAFKHNFATDLLEKTIADSQTKSSNYSCANCSELMEHVDADNMTILICKKCRSAFFEEGQLTQFKNNHYLISDTEVALLGCLPPTLVAFFAFFKFISLDDGKKNKKYYGWLFIISLILIILFWR